MVLQVALVQSQYIPLDPSTRRIFAMLISVLHAGHGRDQPFPFLAEAIFAGFFVAMSFSFLRRGDINRSAAAI
jgi:hypothetical protein